MTRRLRVKRARSARNNVQVLQEKRWWGWKTIDKEVIPEHVLISVGAFGDTGGWTSRFTKHGTFGRDGTINRG